MSESRELIRKDFVVRKLEPVVRMLEEASNAQEAKHVKDLALAAKVYARQQNLGKEAIQKADKIVGRATAKMGAFLKAAPKATGGQPYQKNPTGSRMELVEIPTYADLGIDKKEGADAQLVAEAEEIEPELFEKVCNGEVSIRVAAAQVRRKKRLKEKEASKVIDNDLAAVLAEQRWQVEEADCLDFLKRQSPGSIDLVFGSPPYENARLYLEGGRNLGISRDTDAWVSWMVEVYRAALQCCKGLVAFVVEGRTNKYRWSAAPVLLMAELHRAGIHLRKPPIYRRYGIPGSGGPDWLRNDYEFVVCATNRGKLPWSDNTALGHKPRYEPGGEFSYRQQDGSRVNDGDGYATMEDRNNQGPHRARQRAGRVYFPPDKANPGNIIDCGSAGGGNIGNEICHENEAPFPEKLAEFFVLSFCPPGGLVCDPFAGSGTTLAVGLSHGRRVCGCDLRASQVDLTLRRLSGVTPSLLV